MNEGGGVPQADDVARFRAALLAWFDVHGRKDLPWQVERAPYAVWVSEVMLQQTQVATVIPYFERFLRAFPTLRDLASAPLDAVLAHWSGLGYYARARNLHQAAQVVEREHQGALPAALDALSALPGIGRSTAGAILAMGFGIRAPILDGNVKRVLARYHAVPGWPGEARVLRLLWDIADRYTPSERVGDYTQAMMDLGATLCTRSRPRCPECPVADGCAARREGDAVAYPAAKPARQRPLKTLRFLLLADDQGDLLLERQPSPGIWGGLWSLPSLAPEVDWVRYVDQHYALEASAASDWLPHRHAFTHFELELRPTLARVSPRVGAVREMAGAEVLWYNTRHALPGGCPAPIRRLLEVYAGGHVSPEPTTRTHDDPHGELRTAPQRS